MHDAGLTRSIIPSRSHRNLSPCVAALVAFTSCARTESPRETRAPRADETLARPALPRETGAPWEDETLACAVRAVMDEVEFSDDPAAPLFAALEVAALAVPTGARGWRLGDRAHAQRAIAAIVDAIETTEGSGLAAQRGLVLAKAAGALAELGAHDAARSHANRALAAAASERPSARDAVTQHTAEVLAWTGDAAQARALAASMPLALASAAVGAARGGDREEARRLLAAIPRPDGNEARLVDGLVATAHVWADDLDAARTIVDRQLTSEDRALVRYWAAETAARSGRASAASFVDAAIADARARAMTAPEDPVAVALWVGLVYARDRIAHPEPARVALHDWLLAGPPGSLRWTQIGSNVVQAEWAGLPAEADRLLQAVPPPAMARATLDLAIARGQFERALDVLPRHRAERQARRAQLGTAALPPEVSDVVDVVEVPLWLAFTSAPRDLALVERFRRVFCAASPPFRT